ncbi:MAG: hypothetical protein O6852_04165 [Gammaproteobacteria bacterium]|nr:hypothetical protein [Gammaproteobacteria bacterium]
MPAKTQEEYCEALDEQGEKRVRELKAQGSFSDRHLKWVDLWLENKERADEAAAQERQERQEGREEDSLTISRRANELAIGSLYIAGVSMLFAVVAIVVAFIR